LVPTQSPKVELGVFKLSAYKSLFNKEKQPLGLVYQEAVITDPAVLQADPMKRWAAGDITDPNKGFVLEMSRDSSQYGEYHIGIFTNQGLAYPYPIGDALLAQRYNLYNIDALVCRPTDDETIGKLVRALSGVNPTTREHEWVLLQRVFGAIAGRGVIPQPPAQGYVQGYSMPATAPAAAAPAAAVPPVAATPFPGGQYTGSPVAPATPPRPVDTPTFVPTAPPPFVPPAPVAAPNPPSASNNPVVSPLPGDLPDDKAREAFMAQLQNAFAGRPQG
jgi:hypothetical protein